MRVSGLSNSLSPPPGYSPVGSKPWSAVQGAQGGDLGEHGLDDGHQDVEADRERRGELHEEGLLLRGAVDQRRLLFGLLRHD